jgi:hypothetical protein
VLEEISSGLERDAHGAQVSGSNDVDEDDRAFARSVDLAGHADPPRAIPLQRQRVGQTRGLDAGQRRDAAYDLAAYGGAVREVERGRQVDARGNRA